MGDPAIPAVPEKKPVDFLHNVCGEGDCIKPFFACDVLFCHGRKKNLVKEDPREAKMRDVDGKKCSKCRVFKLFIDPETGKSNFYKGPAKDGYMFQCKVCYSGYSKSKTKGKANKKNGNDPAPPEYGLGVKQDPPVIPMHPCAGPCGRELPLTIENFKRRAGSKNGFTGVCRDCTNKAERVRRGTQEGFIILDFSQDREIYNRLLTSAKKARRNPAQQILFMLETV